MADSYRALCSDFYVNLKLNLKLDLPRERQTVLDLFDRVRRQFPAMNQFRRYRDEVALETEQGQSPNRWAAIRNNNIRAGSVNPETLAEAYNLHQHVLEVAPFFLSISPLDVDFIELLYGFDLQAAGNHDDIVYQALVSGSPLAKLLDIPEARLTDCQPLYGLSVQDGETDVEVNFEVKTRSASRGGREDEPISVYLTLRRFGPVSDVHQLPQVLSQLARLGEDLADSRVVPRLVVPIREAIGSNR
jgi:hypothetical protein